MPYADLVLPSTRSGTGTARSRPCTGGLVFRTLRGSGAKSAEMGICSTSRNTTATSMTAALIDSGGSLSTPVILVIRFARKNTPETVSSPRSRTNWLENLFGPHRLGTVDALP